MSSEYVSATSVTYYFKFQTNKDISSAGKIEITFPSDYSAVHGSFNADAACTGINPSDSTVGLVASYDTGDLILSVSGFKEISKDEIYILVCSGLKNPSVLPPSPYRTGTFTIDLFYDSSYGAATESNSEQQGVKLKL